MEFRNLLLTCLLVLSLAFPIVFSDDDVVIEVEGEEEKPSHPMPPPEIEWEVIKEVTKCKKRLTNDDTAGIHFVGKLASDGSVFYDSREDNEKDEWQGFPMGVGESIKGLELGLIGMCKEEIRRIVVEPEMVINGRNIFDPKDGKIPRGQKLIFEVEMMQMGPNYVKGLPNMFKVYDTNKDELLSHDEVYDTNKDELLSHDEIKEYLIAEGTFGGEGPLVNKLAKEVIDKDDRDKSGTVTWNEFSGPKHEEL